MSMTLFPLMTCVLMFDHEDPYEVDKLAKVWDAKGLLRLVPDALAPRDYRFYSRVFNNYKSVLVDRQIGDRRGQNFREGRLGHGPSHDLPTGVSSLSCRSCQSVLRRA